MPLAIGNLILAFVGFALLVVVRLNKRYDAYHRLLRSKEIAIGVVTIALAAYFAVWTFIFRDEPLTLADFVVTFAVSLGFGLIAWKTSREMRKKFVVRPRP